MKILVIGHARHGKDTVCEMLRDSYGYTFEASSLFCAESVIMPWFARKGAPYASVEACYEDRVNWRSEWHDAIAAFNTPKSRLGRAIWSQYDIYAGLRCNREWAALKNERCYDVAIWVDRSHVASPEPWSSMKLEPWMADFILDNNGTLAELKQSIANLFNHSIGPRKGESYLKGV